MLDVTDVNDLLGDEVWASFKKKKPSVVVVRLLHATRTHGEPSSVYLPHPAVSCPLLQSWLWYYGLSDSHVSQRLEFRSQKPAANGNWKQSLNLRVINIMQVSNIDAL